LQYDGKLKVFNGYINNIKDTSILKIGKDTKKKIFINLKQKEKENKEKMKIEEEKFARL
jgi:hypothetical protein